MVNTYTERERALIELLADYRECEYQVPMGDLPVKGVAKREALLRRVDLALLMTSDALPAKDVE